MRIFDWKKPKTDSILDVDVNIRVIGDRQAGKTAYMAALAYWPNAKPDSPVQSVLSVGNQEAGGKLISLAQNILEQGLELEATNLESKISEAQDYSLSIVLKEGYSNRSGQLLRLRLNCKDYAGEFFADLIHQSGDSKLADYLEDCAIATGILMLVDGTAHRLDQTYAMGLEKFLVALDQAELASKKRRLALVISKCELSQLWVSRHQPRELTIRRFPQVYNKLENWQKNQAGYVDYFATSAFGTLGNTYPEPNTIELKREHRGTKSIIRDPKRWRPFGLIAPIYWLCTGKRHPQLDD